MRPAYSFLLMLVLGTAGCTRMPMLPDTPDIPAQALSPLGTPAVSDGRGRFRQIFCGLLAEQGGAPEECANLLTRLKGEPEAPPKSLLPSPARPRLVLVPGLYNACVNQWVEFYGEALPWLRRQGYPVDLLPVNSRSGSVHNARLIADYMAERQATGERGLVLIGHSKGVVDILRFLVDYPQLTAPVAAVVSVAGAVNGSPLADFMVDGLRGWEALIPQHWCAPGDQKALDDLTGSRRLNWLASNPLPESVRYFSVVTASHQDSVVWPLRYAYQRLAEIDPRNDGTLLAFDQVIPGSELLGYLNTDHWRVAYPVERSIPTFGGSDDFPRHLLLQAAVQYVSEALVRRE